MKALVVAVVPAILVALSVGVVAKLPATPPLEGTKAEEKQAKDAAAAAVAAAQQAKAEDRAVAHYTQQQRAKGKTVTPQMPSNATEMDAKANEANAKVAAVMAAAAKSPVTVQPAAAQQVPKK